MIPNEDLERISCSLQQIQSAFDRVSASLADATPDLSAFVFATMSADAAMRAQDSYREQEQQADAVSPNPNATQGIGVPQPKGKNENEVLSEDAQNAKPTTDYGEKPRNRHQIHKTVKDVGLRGDAGWCE